MSRGLACGGRQGSLATGNVPGARRDEGCAQRVTRLRLCSGWMLAKKQRPSAPAAGSARGADKGDKGRRSDRRRPRRSVWPPRRCTLPLLRGGTGAPPGLGPAPLLHGLPLYAVPKPCAAPDRSSARTVGCWLLWAQPGFFLNGGPQGPFKNACASRMVAWSRPQVMRRLPCLPLPRGAAAAQLRAGARRCSRTAPQGVLASGLGGQQPARLTQASQPGEHGAGGGFAPHQLRQLRAPPLAACCLGPLGSSSALAL